MDMFKVDNVVLDVAAATQNEALQAIADTAVNLGYSDDADDVVVGMLEREAQVSTALMDGIAIPHAKRSSIKEPALIVVRLTQPVDWAGDPIQVALAMLVPEAQAGTTHLRLLAQVSRALIEDEVRKELTSATTAAGVYDVLAARLQF